MPDEQQEVSTLALPIGASVEFPATFIATEINAGFWIRNYCESSIWLGAVWEERDENDQPFEETVLLEETKRQLVMSDPDERFVPTENSSRTLEVEQAICVKSIGQLEERSTEDPSVVQRRVESGELACIHPLDDRILLRLFYYVDDDPGASLSPQQRLGERFLNSLIIETEDNKALKEFRPSGPPSDALRAPFS